MGLDVGERSSDSSDGSDTDDSDERDREVMPAKWTFQIWIFIYVWQFAWIFYAISLVFRRNETTKEFLYVDPSFLPASFYGIYILHLAVSVTWLFAYDNEYHVASFVGLAAMALTLDICLIFAVYLLWLYQDCLSVSEIWANVILVHNGLGLYAAWCTVTALLTLRTMLVETFDIKEEDAATVVLVIILIIVIVYPPIEMWLSNKRLRYVWTPYLTLIVAMAGVIDGHKWDDDSDSANAILKIVIIVLLIIATLTKIGISIYRAFRQPTKIDQISDASSESS